MRLSTSQRCLVDSNVGIKEHLCCKHNYLVSYDFSAYQIFHTPTFPCLVHTTDDWMYRCMRDTCLMLRWFITITPLSTLDIIMIVDVVQLVS